MKPIDWKEVKESSVLILKENEIISIQFLNNGMTEPMEITEGNTVKTVNKYIWQVKDLNDDNTEKEFSTLSKRLLIALKDFVPLKNKKLNINKYREGSEIFDVQFKVAKA